LKWHKLTVWGDWEKKKTLFGTAMHGGRRRDATGGEGEGRKTRLHP